MIGRAADQEGSVVAISEGLNDVRPALGLLHGGSGKVCPPEGPTPAKDVVTAEGMANSKPAVGGGLEIFAAANDHSDDKLVPPVGRIVECRGAGIS